MPISSAMMYYISHNNGRRRFKIAAHWLHIVKHNVSRIGRETCGISSINSNYAFRIITVDTQIVNTSCSPFWMLSQQLNVVSKGKTTNTTRNRLSKTMQHKQNHQVL
jgi:hypothetical protein